MKNDFTESEYMMCSVHMPALLSRPSQFQEKPWYYDSLTTVRKGIKITMVKIPTVLVIVDLSRNKFEGEMPNVIGELHALIGLNLSHNRLIGHIPQSMGNLTNLEWLDLSSNRLTGHIHAELTNLRFLAFLN
ncbi:hypothetical protein TSUD_256060 [Trifolium subterraneum]|uniref:Leucine-rich repeat-containing N-terminal plant-type domain-containing protein n=1 Tax=Trifolium subterraneum TaxID=3900 RepID=A0A2Z6NCT0_TRISU|nr:hypothetical protein TSUD_256060 [Trifolium subterraneum]